MENLDSKEEEYFTWWLQELKECGYVKSFSKSESYPLSEPVYNSYEIKMKTKSKSKEEVLLRDHIYTPDFRVVWADHSIGKLTQRIGSRKDKLILIDDDNVSIIETKGSFDNNNMTRLNTINRKWLYAKHGVFVELIKVPDIFKQTFVPQRYLKTDKTNKPRKINFKKRSLLQFMAGE